MNIISKSALRKFWVIHPEAGRSLKDWFRVVRKANWEKFSDVRKTYNSGDVYEDCVIFNIGGNKYRLVAKVRYKIGRIYVRNIMTHSEYDKEKWKKDCEC